MALGILIHQASSGHVPTFNYSITLTEAGGSSNPELDDLFNEELLANEESEFQLEARGPEDQFGNRENEGFWQMALEKLVNSNLPIGLQFAPNSKKKIQISKGFPNTVGIFSHTVEIQQKKVEFRIEVKPKIGWLTFQYLFLSGLVPAFNTTPEAIDLSDDGRNFEGLLALLFAEKLRTSIRAGLYRDYVEQFDELPVARGRIDVRPTAKNFLRARFQFVNEFEEFTINTSINRILKEACRRSLAVFPDPKDQNDDGLRKKREELGRIRDEYFGDVGRLAPSDLTSELQPHQKSLEEVLKIAKRICHDLYLGTESGSSKTPRGFVINKTADYVERAMRLFLSEQTNFLNYIVEGKSKTLILDEFTSRIWKPEVNISNALGTLKTKSVDPDIALTYIQHSANYQLEDVAHIVGDIKYKISAGKIPSIENSMSQSDLYQLLYFANAFRLRRVLAISFGELENGGEALAPEALITRLRFAAPERLSEKSSNGISKTIEIRLVRFPITPGSATNRVVTTGQMFKNALAIAVSELSSL